MLLTYAYFDMFCLRSIPILQNSILSKFIINNSNIFISGWRIRWRSIALPCERELDIRWANIRQWYART